MTELEKKLSIFGALGALIGAAVFIGTMNGKLEQINSFIDKIDVSEIERVIDRGVVKINASAKNIGSGQIGDVKYSVLNEIKFREVNGDGWILMKQQDISNTTLCRETGYCTLSDARGVFIRGMNSDRERDTGDPEGNRPVGEYQSDMLQKHDHGYSTGGIWNRSWRGDDSGPKTAYAKSSVTTATGGSETRPRNIALYVYIKIN